MNIDMVKRVLLVVNLLTLLPVAVWPIVSPRGFYDNFPGGGLHWIDVNGPYNEHFLIDFGALNAALCAVIGFALWKRADSLVQAAGVAIAVYALPHSIYHLNHLDVYESNEQFIAVAPLVIQIVLGLLIAWPITRTPTPTTTTAPSESASAP